MANFPNNLFNSFKSPGSKDGGSDQTKSMMIMVGVVVFGLMIIGMAIVVGIGAFWGGKDGKVGPGGLGDSVLAASFQDPAVAVALNKVKAAADPEAM
jgi:hypothetical protein